MNKHLKWLCFAILLAVAIQAAAQSETEINQRANDILQKMTLEEKIDYIGGYKDFYIRAIPRLGIPELKMADGPLGVRNYGPSTAYPAGIALAATWDMDLVRQVGTMVGKDARARGVHFLLAPGMNIYRAPMCGRNFEYFGEDPYLASRTAVADISGIQGQGVIATAKHFMGNNQEWDRNRVSSDMDERTMREIYLPAFEASVREAHVGAIMDSYNLVNGVHMTQNGIINNEILKRDWGFDGIVMSDWDATYDGVAAAMGGLDLEMPSGKFMNRQTLIAAIKDGRVPESVVDDKILRILRTALRFGFFNRSQTDASVPLNNPASRKVALQAARESIVLLKNEDILPLDKKKIKSVAVIGPNAAVPVSGGGGSSQVKPFQAVSILDGIRKLAGNDTKVVSTPGVQVMKNVFNSTLFTTDVAGGAGLTAEYFNNLDLKGKPAVTRTDKHVVFEWDQGSYSKNEPTDNFSVRWTGYFKPTHSGTYGLYVAGDDGFRLWIDETLVIDQWVNQGETLISKTMKLEAGKSYKVRLEYYEATGDARIGFGIADVTENRALQTAKDMASKSDIVVLCIGFSAMSEGEGADRSFELPTDQQTLINEIAAANKRTIVVVTAGGNVQMSKWIDSVPGLLHTWYPGQEGGTAIAEVLFGQTNPSGKLPASFEREWKDNATYNSYYDPDGDKHVSYLEGVFLGYRHFDKIATKPLFPFGYGLSYTTFKYGAMNVKSAAGKVFVSINLQNSGTRSGAEVVQLYVAPKQSKVDRPVKELKGFAKVDLRPGETKTVTMELDGRAFAYFDPGSRKWTVDAGEYDLLVGSSSQDIRARSSINMPGSQL